MGDLSGGNFGGTDGPQRDKSDGEAQDEPSVVDTRFARRTCVGPGAGGTSRGSAVANRPLRKSETGMDVAHKDGEEDHGAAAERDDHYRFVRTRMAVRQGLGEDALMQSASTMKLMVLL